MKIVGRDPAKGYIDNWLWLPKRAFNAEALKSALTYDVRDAYADEDTHLELWRETADHLLVPRMVWGPDVSNLGFPVIDARPRSYASIKFVSRVKLDHRGVMTPKGLQILPTGDDTQQRAMTELMRGEEGLLQLACGRGKSCTAMEFIARRGVPAIVLVDNTQLMEQWVEEIGKFLDVPGGVGTIKSGKKEWKHGIVVATYQSIAAWADTMPEEVRRWFGTIVADEGHHAGAPVFSRCLSLFYGFRLLLTATPKRRDGFHIIARMHAGDTIFKNLKPLMTPWLLFKSTPMMLNEKNKAMQDKTGNLHLSRIYSYFGKHTQRLGMILTDCWSLLQRRRKILVLCNSVSEVMNLLAMWTRTVDGTPVALLHELPKLRDKKAAEAQLQDWIAEVLSKSKTAGAVAYDVPLKMRRGFLKTRQLNFAITKYGKEGLDDPALDTILVSSLFTDDGMLTQINGRPTRPWPGKQEPMVIFYVDNLKPLVNMSRQLMQHLNRWPVDEGGPYLYQRINYKDPASRTTLEEALNARLQKTTARTR